MTAATISIIVPAAGRGARANLEINKVFAPLNGQPLLYWTLRALVQAPLPPEFRLQEVIIASRAEERDFINLLIVPFQLFAELPNDPSPRNPTFHLVEGGAERQESVANAVQSATGDFVLVHDAARPLVSDALIARVCQAARQDGAAIPAVPASDTVKVAVRQSGRMVVGQTLERGAIWLVQTPQVFRREILQKALALANQTGFKGTDCASLVERLTAASGEPLYPVTIVEGEAINFKVTYPPDLERAATLLSQEAPTVIKD